MAVLLGPAVGSWRWWWRERRLAWHLDITACCVVAMRPLDMWLSIACRWCGRRLDYREIKELEHDALIMGLLVPRRWITKAELRKLQRRGVYK